jgi:hypothetical protein
MVTTIADALGGIKEELARVLEPAMLTKLCREVGHQWRDRLLDPVTTTNEETGSGLVSGKIETGSGLVSGKIARS